MQFRQGDVLVESANETLLDDKPLEAENGRVILAHGEATGHAHAISAKDAKMFVAGVIRRIKVQRPTRLLHEEHAPIPLEKGSYNVIRQKEYTPAEIRNVAD